MFGFAKQKTGSEAINEAIGEFEDIAARIESGVADNKGRIYDNKIAIVNLEADNVALETAASRGESVAAKLRSLVS
jgi:hypothetical protein